jgi:hypothetical protein
MLYEHDKIIGQTKGVKMSYSEISQVETSSR